MTDTRNYIVSIDKPDGSPALLSFRFCLIYPQSNTKYYGTGCYMEIETPDGWTENVDVRYTGKKYLPDLVELWLKSKYGDRLKGWREL